MYYPVFLELRGKPVLVAGGGPVAERKVESLLEAEASITVVSPEATRGIVEHAERGELVLRRRRFQESDLDGVILAFSATDDVAVQKEIAAVAQSKRVPVNTADQPALCDFIVPAIVRRGDVLVAISTSGSSPALAAALRARVEKLVTHDTARAARILGEVRNEVHERFPDPTQRKEALERIVDSGILDWISECDDATALERARKLLEGSR